MNDSTTDPIAMLMERQGITLDELAEQSGISLRTIYNVRHGVVRPSNGTVALLAYELGITPARLRKMLDKHPA